MQEAEPVKKVGVLGGTFDPVHLGHLALARFVRRRLELDKFLFIPAARPPHKARGGLTPFAIRQEMLRLALQDEPEFMLSALEEARRGPSYSVDTLRELRRLHGSGVSFFFVVGLDAFLELNTWKNYRDLPRLTNLVVIDRADYPLDLAAATIEELGPYRFDPECSCWVASGLPGRIYLLTMEPVEISSTMVRRKVAAGASLQGLVPPAVARCIQAHRLYLD